jgi:hypothetical protein
MLPVENFFLILPNSEKTMDIQEHQERRERVNARSHSIRDIGWGVFYILVGAFLIFHNSWGFAVDRVFISSRTMDISLGILAPIYGIWRIIRGVQKKY